MTRRTLLTLCPTVMVVHPDFVSLASFMCSLPMLFRHREGTLIYQRRNQLRQFEVEGQSLVVKRFARPNLINRLVYGIFRKSKARRSYEYALMLRRIGVGSPMPVGYFTQRRWWLFFDISYYVCLRSTLPYSYNNIIGHTLSSDEEKQYLRAIAQTTARMHEAGILHSDYSQGNILFGPGEDGNPRVEVIDLNRIRFREVSLESGCRNYADRLPTDERQRRIVAEAYAEARGFDADKCYTCLTKAYESKN